MGEHREMITVSTTNLFLFFVILYSVFLLAFPGNDYYLVTWKRRVIALLAVCSVSLGIVLLLWAIWGV